MSRVLEQVKEKYAGKVQVLSVVTMPDTVNTVQKYIQENKVTTPVLFDCGQMMASYLKLGPSNTTVDLPTVYIIDRNGMSFSGNYISHQTFTPSVIFLSNDRTLPYCWMLSQHSFDFTGFNSETSNLYLIVNPTKKLNVTVRQVAS